jgi:transposase
MAQSGARAKQDVVADLKALDGDLRAMLEAQMHDLEQRIAGILSQEKTLAAKAELLRSIPGIGPVSAAMLLAQMPELGRMTAGEAASMIGLAPVSHGSGAMRGRRSIARGRRALRHVLFQAALAAAYHNPLLKPVAKRLKEKGKSHKLVIIDVARRLITIANAVLKTGTLWHYHPAAWTQLLVIAVLIQEN